MPRESRKDSSELKPVVMGKIVTHRVVHKLHPFVSIPKATVCDSRTLDSVLLHLSSSHFCICACASVWGGGVQIGSILRLLVQQVEP